MTQKKSNKKSIQSCSDKGDALALREKNLEYLKEYMGHLYERLANHTPISKLVYDDEGEPNVKFNEFSMYPDGAITYAKNQTDRLNMNAVRLEMTLPEEGGLKSDPAAENARKNLAKRFKESGLKFAGKPIRENAYCLIVLGVGLGQHLVELIQRTQCRILLLLEPNIDLLYHSLEIFDWSKLTEYMGNEGTIEMYMSDNPKDMQEMVKGSFKRYNPAGLDGTILFRHYGGSIFSEFERGLADIMRTSIYGLGFFSDEINMIGQSYKNLENGDSRIIKKFDHSSEIPVFIIGTGPSLEELIPFVKEQQDKAVIVSCGTSIDILMQNGIKPDFWAMAERDEEVLQQSQETHELYNTKDIYFLGSTTIFPGVYKLFKDTVFFFRPGLSCSPLWASHHDQICQIPDPLAANAGLSAALQLGFREFYFIGVDTGSKYQTHGHAKGGWYTRHNYEIIKDMTLTLPGNFGGQVWTTPELQWSKENMQRLIGFMGGGRSYFNLGDGALIKGAIPKHPKALKLKKPEKPKEEIVSELVKKCEKFTVAQFEERWELSAVIDRLPEFCDALKDATKIENDINNFDFMRRTTELLQIANTRHSVPMIVRGTLLTVIIVNQIYANRLIDPLEREVQIKIFREEYCSLVDSLCDRATEIFKQLEDGMTWEQFLE